MTTSIVQMIEKLTTDGYSVHIHQPNDNYIVTVTDKRLTVSRGESAILVEALADAYDMTPERE
jgi:hypothetical protein